jgi:3-hydroxy-3-methylglutaryl CoA synthase/uncharacterized OB-fold protein
MSTDARSSSATVGIVSYGAYVPRHRLRRAAISEVLGTPAAPGTRAVAGYDEDSTTLAVEAARVACRRIDVRSLDGVYFATATPAYLEKTNATAIHAALDLADEAIAVDMAGALRCAAAVWRAAVDAAAAGRTTLATFGDVRTGMPGGADERDGGDAGAALVFGREAVVAEVLAMSSRTREFLDRWRLPSDEAPQTWEERFGEQVYVPLAQTCVADVLERTGVRLDQVDHLIVGGAHSRAVRQLPKALGLAHALVPDLAEQLGNAGVAHAALALTDLLDRAAPGETIVLVNLADGVDAVLLRTTEAISSYGAESATHHARSKLGAQLATADDALPYATFLTWRRQLVREPPRREEPGRPMAPVANRREGWKFGFVGSRCLDCGTRHLPPQRVCFSCQAVDRMASQTFADTPGSVSTFTIDRLAFSPSPPVIGAVVDFDGGGRYQCEVTDVHPDRVGIGTRVEPTFRRLYTAGGIHDYFWKLRPILG